MPLDELSISMAGHGAPLESNKMNLQLLIIPKNDKDLTYARLTHYTESNGFIGRTIIYKILFNNQLYGFIVAGSATKNLPGRENFWGNLPLNSIVNNTFFQIKKVNGKYPIRNFVPYVLKHFRFAACQDWLKKYGDPVLGFETLVELPRTGEIYIRDGWTEIGITKGYTCKRWSEKSFGESSDSWGGKRVWNYTELKPKRVFAKLAY